LRDLLARYWTAADTQHVTIFVPRLQAHPCYNRNFPYSLMCTLHPKFIALSTIS